MAVESALLFICPSSYCQDRESKNEKDGADSKKEGSISHPDRTRMIAVVVVKISVVHNHCQSLIVNLLRSGLSGLLK